MKEKSINLGDLNKLHIWFAHKKTRRLLKALQQQKHVETTSATTTETC